jgi:hypothetical protein
MDSVTCDELAVSVRLLAGEERRLLAGLLGGGAGYFVWLSGTGATAERLVESVLGPVSVSPWSAEATLLVVTFSVMWVLLPSVLAVRFVVDEVTNVRGNVEKRYRLERPFVLLVPPFVGLFVVLGAGLVGGFGMGLLFVLGFVSAVSLVRTVAYGYRVYALSAPRGLQTLLFATAVFVSLATAVTSAGLAGQGELVVVAVSWAGLSGVAFGTVPVAGTAVPVLSLASATIPAIAALTYVAVQLLAGTVVRARQPEVPRSALRAGQRHPRVVQPGNGGRLAADTRPGKTEGDPTGGDDPDGTTSAAPTSVAGENGPIDGDGTDQGDDGDEDDSSNRFGQTRVYTPGSDPESPDQITGASVKNELCPICGTTYEADPDRTHCPNCNAILNQE